MAVGRAAKIHASRGVRVAMGQPGRRYWSQVFHNVPYIVQPTERTTAETYWLDDVPGRRKYIDYKLSTAQRQVLVPTFRAQPGHLFFDTEEEFMAQSFLARHNLKPGFVVVEPHVKGTFSGPNKAWPARHWVELVDRWHSYELVDPAFNVPVVQVSPPHQETIPGVDFRATLEVRAALALLKYASVVITTDGLLHHAAAALDVPAVVIWGARTNPEILGYTQHRNLTHGNSWCGSMRKACQHCEEAMLAITPDRVLEAATSCWRKAS